MAEQSAPPVPRNRIAIVVGVRSEAASAAPLTAAAGDAFAAILDELRATCPHTPLVVIAQVSAHAGRRALEIAAARDLATVACLAVESGAYLAAMSDADERDAAARTLERCGRIDVAAGDEAAYVATFADVLVTFAHGPAETPFVEPRGHDDAVLYRIEAGADDGPEARDVRVVTSFPARFSGDDLARDVAAARARIDQYNADLEGEGTAEGAGTTIDALCDVTSEIASRLQSTTFRFLFILYATAIVATAAQYTTSQFFKYAMLPIAFVTYRIARRFDYENRYQDYRALSEGLRVQAAWFGGGLYDEQSHRSYLGMQERELLWIRVALRYAYFAFRPDRSVLERAPSPAAPEGSRPWIAGQIAYFKKAARREERRLAATGRLSRAAFWSALVAAAVILIVLDAPTAPERVASLAASAVGAAHGNAGLSAWLASLSVSAGGLQRSWMAAPAWSTGWFGALRLWTSAPGPHGWLVRLSTGVFALYTAVALLISNYNEKRGFAVNVKRYDRMFVVFERAQAHLDALGPADVEAARDVVRNLGRAALIENADWLLTRREKPLAFVS